MEQKTQQLLPGADGVSAPWDTYPCLYYLSYKMQKVIQHMLVLMNPSSG